MVRETAWAILQLAGTSCRLRVVFKHLHTNAAHFLALVRSRCAIAHDPGLRTSELIHHLHRRCVCGQCRCGCVLTNAVSKCAAEIEYTRGLPSESHTVRASSAQPTRNRSKEVRVLLKVPMRDRTIPTEQAARERAMHRVQAATIMIHSVTLWGSTCCSRSEFPSLFCFELSDQRWVAELRGLLPRVCRSVIAHPSHFVLSLMIRASYRNDAIHLVDTGLIVHVRTSGCALCIRRRFYPSRLCVGCSPT
jgi:hypothetical protein